MSTYLLFNARRLPLIDESMSSGPIYMSLVTQDLTKHEMILRCYKSLYETEQAHAIVGMITPLQGYQVISIEDIKVVSCFI